MSLIVACISAACSVTGQSRDDGARGTRDDGTPGASEDGSRDAPGDDRPAPCPAIGLVCASFALRLESPEPWPLGRYFLRVAVDAQPPSVCEIAFEPVAGLVADTCNRESGGDFQVAYTYDNRSRSIDSVTFGPSVAEVELELLVSDEVPPLAEVHHHVTYELKTLGEPPCTQACTEAVPLTVAVQHGGTLDAGSAAGDGGSNAASQAPLSNDAGTSADAGVTAAPRSDAGILRDATP